MTEMRHVDHTHPVTDRPFGERFRWTTPIVADGGESEPAENDGSGGDDEQHSHAMGDVDHESPDGTGADRVFERGPPRREDEE